MSENNEYYNDARILEEHEIAEQKENVVAGIIGAMIFSLAGGVLWFVLSQVGFYSAISGVVGVVCANIGYRLFANGEIDYTITFAQAVRGAYVFLSEPEIARPYLGDLAIGLLLCAVGAFRFVKNSIARYR